MIVKIWNIKGNASNGGKKGLSQSLDYITSKEKTYDAPDEDYEKSRDISRALEYMNDEFKIEQKYISGYLCDPEFAVEQFVQTRERNLARVGKEEDDGNIAYHIIQSFPVDLEISNEEVHQCGLELCKKLGLHQAVVCSHVHPVTDKDGNITGLQKHNHILMNAHTTDPERQYGSIKKMKYNDSKESYALLQRYNDEIAIAHDLPIIDNPDREKKRSWSEYDAIRKNTSWKQKIREDIEEAILATSTWDDYISLMESKGYEVKQGKYVSYRAKGQERSVRDKTLGRDYTKEGIIAGWTEQKEIEDFLEKEVKLNSGDIYRLSIPNSMLTFGEKGILVNIPGLQKPFILENSEFQRINEDNVEIFISDKKSYGALTGKAILKGYIAMDSSQKYQAEFDYTKKDIEVRSCTIQNATKSEDRITFRLPGSNKTITLDKNDYKQLTDKSYQIFLYSNKEYEVDGQKVSGDSLMKFLPRNKEYEESKTYFNPKFINSKTNKPYRIGLYTNTGRKRTMVELVLLLAMTAMKHEAIQPGIPNQSHVDYKLQSMMDAVKISREENISSSLDIKARLNEVGTEISKLKLQAKRTDTTLNKMEVIHKAVMLFQEVQAKCEAIHAMPEGAEKTKAIQENREAIQQYTEAKAVLYRYKVEGDIEGFERRYQEQIGKAKETSNRLDLASEEYRKLKKLEYQLAMAEEPTYVYGKEPDRELQREEQEKDREKNKNL